MYQTRRELREAVESEAGLHLLDEDWQDLLPEAPGPYSEATVQEILTEYCGWREAKREGPEESEDRLLRPRAKAHTPVTKILAQVWREAIALTPGCIHPWDDMFVVAWRRKLFREPNKPPFPDDAAAMRWLGEHTPKLKDIWDHLGGHIEYTSCDGKMTLYPVPLEQPMELLQPLECCPDDGKIRSLDAKAQTLASLLGCDVGSAVRYFLTGVEPVIPPVSWTVKKSATGAQISVQVNFPSIVPKRLVEWTYTEAMTIAQQEGHIPPGRRARPAAKSTEARIFIAGHPGLEGDELRKAWNRTHPEPERFVDCRDLYSLASKGH